MTTINDINSIIDNLANKLGTTATKLLPELVKYEIANSLATLVISAIIMVVSGVFISICIHILNVHEKSDKYYDDEIFIFPLFCGGIFFIISFIITMVSIHSLIVWSNAPTGAAVYYILNGFHSN